MFNPEAIRNHMETLRCPNGAFIAAPTSDYGAMWIRDTLYTSFAYWYTRDFEKLKEGIQRVFDVFRLHEEKIRIRIASPVDMAGGFIHAKFNPDTLEEITKDEGWGHHQLDALGLFLHIVADLDFKNIRVARDEKDLEILQLLVYYLRSVEYWEHPDHGMWEECRVRHSSSIGAVVGGLSYIRKQRLALVPDPLIRVGEMALDAILPYESRDTCTRPHHRHDCDSAQLSLIWPYHILNRERAEEILHRVTDGHSNGESHRLKQTRGLNRYWGDDYYRSNKGAWTGISAEWPLFSFWTSIIYSQWHEYAEALRWFEHGCAAITNDMIPEAYQNGGPNDHTPLAWAHAMSLIAFSKLPSETKKCISKTGI